MFVVFSAFGTTGLSTVDVASLTVASKSILILVMFIGQLGILASLKIFSGRDNVSKASKRGTMIEENLPIG
jgi:Trk-type K+ transport system membrane component